MCVESHERGVIAVAFLWGCDPYLSLAHVGVRAPADLFDRSLPLNIWNGNRVTDAERLQKIEQKLRCGVGRAYAASTRVRWFALSPAP